MLRHAAQVAAAEHSAMHREATGSLTHQRRYAELVTELRRHRNQADGIGSPAAPLTPPTML
jgi:hypothetical protein